MEEKNESKPKRQLNPDKFGAGVGSEGLRPPTTPAIPEKKMALSAVAGRAVVGAALLAFGGVILYFVLPKGKAPEMAVPTQVVAQVNKTAPTSAPKTQSAAPTAAKMVELKPVGTMAPKPTVAAKVEPTPASATKALTANKLPKALPFAAAGALDPLFAPTYDAKDGLPVMVCGIKPLASNLTLINMQVQGIDVKNGFHLALVPLALDAKYDIPDAVHMPLLRENKWNCFLEQIEELSVWDIGVVTALLDEATGETGIWGRDMENLYDLKNKSISFVEDSSSQYFLDYALALLPSDAASSVKKVGFPTHQEALKAFMDGDVDGISGWHPMVESTGEKGAKPVLVTSQLRISTNAIVMSRKYIAERPEVVRAFHKAFFETLRNQVDRPAQAAAAIATWGHNRVHGHLARECGAGLRRRDEDLGDRKPGSKHRAHEGSEAPAEDDGSRAQVAEGGWPRYRDHRDERPNRPQLCDCA